MAEVGIIVNFTMLKLIIINYKRMKVTFTLGVGVTMVIVLTATPVGPVHVMTARPLATRHVRRLTLVNVYVMT